MSGFLLVKSFYPNTVEFVEFLLDMTIIKQKKRGFLSSHAYSCSKWVHFSAWTLAGHNVFLCKLAAGHSSWWHMLTWQSAPQVGTNSLKRWNTDSLVLFFIVLLNRVYKLMKTSTVFQMAAAASNKTISKKDLSYPELEENALQFILDTCESSISKYSKFLQVIQLLLKLIYPFAKYRSIILHILLLLMPQASGSMDLDVTNPKLLNRKVFLKQLAVDLCTSEQRILFRTQYVST